MDTASRLAGDTMRICGQVAWEVDAALRPEGRSGALVRTLASHQAYYRRWASTWEFQALLKARPIAGDLALGADYLAALAPLVWTASQRPDFVADVQAMRRRVVEQLPPTWSTGRSSSARAACAMSSSPSSCCSWCTAGPIRRCRSPAPCRHWRRCATAGFVGRDDAVSLADAYRFLRAAEHRLQLVKLRRTHLVPDDRAALLRLARSMGFRPDARGDAVAVWQAEWALHAREVRRLHEKLFYRPLLESVARVPTEALRLTESEARRRLEALGYADPAGALRHIDALTAGVSRRAALQRALLPVILSELADAPDPDRGLLSYRQVSEALGTSPWFLRLLRDEGTVASRLARLLGTSRYVADLLVRAPEALQLLADDGQLQPRRRPELEAADGHRGPPAGRAWSRPRTRFAACAGWNCSGWPAPTCSGVLDEAEVRLGLSDLADATLGAALAASRRLVAAEQPPRGRRQPAGEPGSSR